MVIKLVCLMYYIVFFALLGVNIINKAMQKYRNNRYITDYREAYLTASNNK
jgi:hypothetical protein